MGWQGKPFGKESMPKKPVKEEKELEEETLVLARGWSLFCISTAMQVETFPPGREERMIEVAKRFTHYIVTGE